MENLPVEVGGANLQHWEWQQQLQQGQPLLLEQQLKKTTVVVKLEYVVNRFFLLLAPLSLILEFVEGPIQEHTTFSLLYVFNMCYREELTLHNTVEHFNGS